MRQWKAWGDHPVVAMLSVVVGVATLWSLWRMDPPANEANPTLPIASEAAPSIDSPAPLRIVSAELGRALRSDGHVTERVSKFGQNDTIYLSVFTADGSPGDTLSVRWLYHNGQVVSEGEQLLAFLARGEIAATEFHIAKPTPWPKGRYAVSVSIGSRRLIAETFAVE